MRGTACEIYDYDEDETISLCSFDLYSLMLFKQVISSKVSDNLIDDIELCSEDTELKLDSSTISLPDCSPYDKGDIATGICM